jgi:hypothetical protein
VNGFEVIVRRVGGVAWVAGNTANLLAAYEMRNRLVSEYQRTGFAGKRNTAGVWRLAKRDGGRRVRLAVYVRPVATPVCWN